MNADAGAALNRNLGAPTALGEDVETANDAFIARRHEQRRRTEGAEEEAWMESVRRYNARRREENRRAWREDHQGQAARLRNIVGPLIAFHEGEAAKLCGEEAS
jgi:hypothetical protein